MALATKAAPKADKVEKVEAGDLNTAAGKMKALQLTLDKLDKAYGKGTVMKLSDNKVADIPSISTGSLSLDIALGIGGVPRGRVIEMRAEIRRERDDAIIADGTATFFRVPESKAAEWNALYLGEQASSVAFEGG